MNALPGTAALAVLCFALLIAQFSGRRKPAKPDQSMSYPNLEGLRGLLATMVFLCHASAWYGVTHQQGWGSDAGLFQHFGQGSVALFFMITAFLFIGRLVDARDRPVDWLRLYVSRVLRLTPAYWVALALMLTVLAFVTWAHIDGAGTGIVLRTWGDILPSVGVWVTFCMLGYPPIDAYMDTAMIMAGVVWSLPFEWTFYGLLPVFALLLPTRRTLPATAMALGLATVIWTFLWGQRADLRLALPFLGGVVAVAAVRWPAFVTFARKPAGSIAALLSLLSLVVFCPSPMGALPLALQTIAFALIASGSSLFGLLQSRGARVLGSLSYGIYLMHGIVLYMAFMVIIGFQRTQAFTPWQYWAIVLCLVPLLLALTTACHRWVELPAMRLVGPCTGRLRKLIRRGQLPRAQAAGQSEAS